MQSMIFGAGSLGTILGALLTEGGADVTLVSRNEAHIRALQQKGATITGTMEKCVPVKACLPEELHGSYDLILLMTKQLDNPGNVVRLLPRLREGGAFCCLQNGIPELSLQGVVPDKTILGGVVAWSATWQGPGVSELTSPPDSVGVTLGSPFSPQVETMLAQAAELLRQAGWVRIEEDILSMRWSKLLVNASVSALSSSLGLPCGGVTHDPKFQELSLRVLKECVDVGRARGVQFRPVNGYPVAEVLYFTDAAGLQRARERMPEVFDSIRTSVSSILQDLRRGRTTEVEAISGIVCRCGRASGIPTPFNDRVVDVIREIQQGRRLCGPENFAAYQELLARPVAGKENE